MGGAYARAPNGALSFRRSYTPSMSGGDSCGCGGPLEDEVTGGRAAKRPSRGRGKVRPGPPSSATLFAIGTRRKGGDGNMWSVVQTKTGARRWKRIVKKATGGAAHAKSAKGAKRAKSASARKKGARKTSK